MARTTANSPRGDLDAVTHAYETVRHHLTRAASTLVQMPTSEDIDQVVADLQGINDTLGYLLAEHQTQTD